MGETERTGKTVIEGKKKNYECYKQPSQFQICFAFACLSVLLKLDFMQNGIGRGESNFLNVVKKKDHISNISKQDLVSHALCCTT